MSPEEKQLHHCFQIEQLCISVQPAWSFLYGKSSLPQVTGLESKSTKMSVWALFPDFPIRISLTAVRQAGKELFPVLAPWPHLIQGVSGREFIWKMQVSVYFVEVFFSSHEQSILKVECDCLPETESYVILALFWTHPQSQMCPRAVRCWDGIWSS